MLQNFHLLLLLLILQIKVHINDIHGSQMAAKINGNFTVDDNEFRFTAIAFGRIGGQNVAAKLSQTTETELKKLGYDVDEVIMKLQQNLLQGDLTLPEGLFLFVFYLLPISFSSFTAFLFSVSISVSNIFL